MNCKFAEQLIDMIQMIKREDWEIIKKIIDEDFDILKQNYEDAVKVTSCKFREIYKLRDLNPNKYKEENLND